MTSKERVFATMNFEPVDRPAVFPLEGSGWISKHKGYSYAEMYELPDFGAADLVEGFEQMKSDVVFCGGSGWMAWANAFGSTVDATTVGAPVNVGKAFKPEDVPDLTDDEIREKLLDNYYVKAMVGQIRACHELVGDEKVLMAGHTGPFTGASILVGTNAFIKMVGKKDKKPEYAEYLAKLLDFSARALAIYGDILIDAGTTVLNICDPVSSGDMIAMKTYNELAYPALSKYRETRKKDAPFLMHICGHAGERVDIVREFGASFFSVDSMVDMAEMLKKCDHKMCMVGNINPAEVMLQGTPEKVYEESMKLLELGKANGGGLVVCTGCELPADSPLENILAMVKATEDAYA